MKPTDPCVSVGSGRVRAVGAGPAGNFFGFSGLLGSVAGGLIQPPLTPLSPSLWFKGLKVSWKKLTVYKK
ncbi:hypothetical protein P8452_37958 [Trifolium repens]|nr:hypothetical protein P8452_37958 [Trifolium repens]